MKYGKELIFLLLIPISDPYNPNMLSKQFLAFARALLLWQYWGSNFLSAQGALVFNQGLFQFFITGVMVISILFPFFSFFSFFLLFFFFSLLFLLFFSFLFFLLLLLGGLSPPGPPEAQAPILCICCINLYPLLTIRKIYDKKRLL